MLVDSIHNTVMVSSSLAGLYYNPFVITCNVGAEEDSHFRVILFSHDACGLRTEPGLTSYHDAVEPSAAPVAIALVPETFTAPKEHVFTEGVVLLDTVQRTEEACSTAWEYAQGVLSDGDGMLFHLDDTVTMIQQGTLVQVYCQGILVASITLNEEQAAQRHRLLIYLGASGLSATFVPPLFGKTHLGRVVKVHGPDVCELECVAEEPLVRRRYVVRKKDVRFCALAASNYPRAALKEGTHVAFKSGGLQLPKRGTIVNTSNEAINVCDEEDDRTITAVSFDHCFLLNNEGKYVTNQALYPLVTPPTSTVTRAFEVGKSKYRIQKKGSYNGIIFDCKASDTVDLLGLSVLSHTTGRHRVDVFFKKGTHKNFEREPRAWTTLFTQFVEMNLEHYFSVSFAAVHIEAGSTFALYINTSHNCGVGFYCEEDGCQGDVGSELDDDGTITVYLGRKSGSSNAFGDFGLDPRGFCGTILYKQSKGAKPPLIEGAGQASQGPVQENGPAIRGDLIALISRPPVTAHANTLRFTVEVLKVPVRVEHVRLPVQLLSTGEVASGLVRCVVSMFYTKLPDDDAEYGVGGAADGWHWAWNCRVVLSHDSPEVCLCGADLRLAKGKYLFAVVARRCLLQASMSGVGVQLFQPSDSQYSRRNSLVSVEGLYGELLVETDAPAVSGELHTMTTGSFLNQNNSASYNGIMFDIRSKQDITLEEIYCISQTTADHVTVRLFWKEGSMEGAEKSHMQWREVATKELQLVDKQPFSVGSLYLRMRANQTYAVFINTTSSCGVRFYNSSDGHVGEIGDEFENDGIVSVYVGRKSESSTPFSEIPVEPRAFRGKILYRTFILSTSETMDQAMFSYLRAFIVTRMLVALSSYVDSSDASTDGHFSYDKLLATVATLATSPNKSISDLHGAEKMLASLLRDSSSEEIRSGVVTVALPRDSSHLQMSLGKGDLALLTNPQKSSTSQLVRLLSDADPSDSTFPVHVLGGLAEETAAFRVPRKRLLPVTKCWQCQLPYVAEGPCSACGGPHLPPPNEDARITAILADRVMQQHDTTPAEALQMAKGLLQKPVEGLESVAYSLSIRESHITVPTMESTVSPDGSITFAIPTSRLLTEEDNVEGVQFTCPFVFHTPLRAYVALQVHATAHNVSLFVVTDYPLREHTNLSPRYFRCCLSYDADAAGGDSVGTLTPSPVLFTACGGACGELAVELVKRLDPSSCASHNHNGVVKFTLTMVAAPPPPLTPTLDTPSEPWAWENGAAEADLQPGTLTFLAADFSASSWPRSKPHFCTFMVESKGLDKAVFLEVHVIEVYQPRPLWGDATRTQTRTKTRKPFSLASGEVVTLGFSEDDGFFVYDEDDVVRCQITPEELRVSSKSAFNRIGFVCVHQEKVLAMLSVPDDLRRSARAANAPEHPTRQVGSDYEPAWEVLDESQVRLSKNKLTASCCSEQGGQAVLGSPMPDRGMFAFVIQLERRDRPLGASLGSGHFAGVALSSFSQTAPHFGELKTMTDKLWVVQDVQDGDSLPTQAPIPALEREEKTNELFGVGTKLLFIVDRNAGTLSFGRDEESPRVVFQDLPHNEVLRPFVRLDHTDSSATLSRFSHTQSLSLLSQPSLERAATSQPLTASLLRRFPLAVVLKLFPVFQCVVNALPTAQAARLECCWNDVHTHSRFDYRVAKAVETMVEHGCFSPRLMYAPRDALNEVVSPTLLSSLVALLTEEGNDSIVSLPGRHSGEVDVEGVLFRLPPAYEVLGRVHGTNMLRLLFLTEEGSPAERTLHLMYLDDPASTLHSSTCILPHPSVLRQRTILPSVNCANACGVVVDGWFDCTLAASDSLRLDEQQEKRIFSAIMFAVEHWHLHGLPHGHLTPANVHLRITHGIVVNCCLWNLHYLDRSSPYASNTLREQGVRDFKADLGSCALLLRSLHSIIQADPTVQRCVQLLDEGVLSVSEILQESDVFQDTTEEGGLEGPTGTLKTGARLRGGSGSYNGIMFDVVAKSTAVRVTKLTFVPDTNSTALVSLFTKPMSFLGSENDSSVWTKVYEKEMDLKDNVDTTVDGFDPITISACSKAGFFLHTTSGSGVLFYSENEGVQAGMGQVEEENGDIGITVGKKCESLIPFTAIQNQKRLLKGSITYTLITRANGPRSSLIYSFDEKSHGWPAKSNSTVEPVRVEGGDGVGLHLLSSGPSSLVLFPSKKALWVPSSRVHATSYNEAGAGLPEMERELCTLRRKRNERVLSDHCPERYVAGMSLRPVSFYSVSASAESVSHPSMQPGAWWWSEPLSECVTLSLWHATQVDCNVYLFQGGFDAARVAQGKNLMEGKAALFLRVDPTLKCVVVTSVKAKRRVVRVEGFPIRVAVRAGKSIAAAGSCQLFAYAHIPETWRRRHVTGHCTAVCLNPVDVNAATARADDTLVSTFDCVARISSSAAAADGREEGGMPNVEILAGPPTSVRLFALPDDPATATPVAPTLIANTAEQTHQTLSHRHPLNVWMESQQAAPRDNMADVLLSVNTPALKGDQRTVTQILHSAPAPATVLSPRFTATEAHEVLLKLRYPRQRAVAVSLVHPMNLHSPVDLPYATFHTLDGVSDGEPDGEEVYLHLHIDLLSQRILLRASSGTCFDAVSDKSALSELQLSFTLFSPGTSVEIVEWRVSLPRVEEPMSVKRFGKALGCLESTAVPANQAQTVGVLTRHSARMNAPATRENSLTATKQMEVLIVSYARVLLEKALAAQDGARRAVQRRLHYLLSFTSLRSSHSISGILEGEAKQGSFDLVAQACANLSSPSLLQPPQSVETSVNIVANAMTMEVSREALTTVFGPSIALLLLRTATVFSRATRHAALNCAQELLSNEKYPLPPHELLATHLGPLLRMMGGLCKRGRMSSAVVQIGVTLVANLVQRYAKERPSLPPPGARSAIPYQIIVCTRAVIESITRVPPQPLPAAMTRPAKPDHRINCTFTIRPLTSQGHVPEYGWFTEENRDPSGHKSFEVSLAWPRHGAVIVGWELNDGGSEAAPEARPEQSRYATEEEPLPSCGYYIEPVYGKVFVCVGRKREASALRVKAKAGDVVIVSTCYRQREITVSLRRENRKMLSTTFNLATHESIALPFYFAQNKADAVLHVQGLRSGSINLDVGEMYADLLRNPAAQDEEAPPQSYEFYEELNLFWRDMISKDGKFTMDTEDGKAGPSTLVLTHELAAYTHLSSFVGAGALAEETSIDCLRPYFKRLKLFDALTAAFSPLINLQRKSELFDIFRVLKNLCSKETEEAFQETIMRPFQNRQGRKVHVTVHAMQAQPSASLGPFPTLMRSVFGQLYLQLHRSTIDTFFASPMFTVKLAGFGSTDAGGPYRDVLSQLATEIMTGHPSGQFQLNPLFIQCGRGGATAIMPNPGLMSSSQVPLMLEFLGKLLASFFITNDLLAVEFPPLFWKLLLSEETSIKDLAVLDPDIVQQLKPEELMERTEEELEERFPGIGETWKALVSQNPSRTQDDTLPPTSPEAATLLSDSIVNSELSRFVEAMTFIQQGFDEVLPLYTLQAFRWQKVELQICGTQKLSFDAFRDECDVQLPENEAEMFLGVLESMTDDDRRLLLRFTTGQSRLPLKARIKVQHNGSKNSLPTSSTCFFTLRLPSYTTAAIMKERLLYAVRQCKAIDADGQARENLILDV